ANALCRKGDTIIDVGANVGTETVIFAAIVGPEGRIVAFEPLRSNVDRLRSAVHLNGLNHVCVVEAAVSDRSGVAYFQAPVDGWNNGTGRLCSRDEGHQNGAFHVRTVTLNELWGDGLLPRPRLIVMDVEGFEIEVLRGSAKLLADSHPHIILEINPLLLQSRGLSVCTIRDWLADWGYQSWDICRWGLREATPNQRHLSNWIALSDGLSRTAQATASRLSRRLRAAAVLPLIRAVNPA